MGKKKSAYNKLIPQAINQITGVLLEKSIVDEFNNLRTSNVHGTTQISFENDSEISFSMKNYDYQDIYSWLLREKCFNYKLLDGALIQMSYTCTKDKILKHRLAFFPCPNLEDYSQDPESYEQDHLYAEFFNRRTVPTPVRFDFSANEEEFKALEHPKSHLTLGQYTECRIPVCSPIDPHSFIDFILRYFYRKAHIPIEKRIAGQRTKFPESIHATERKTLHMVVGI